MSFITLFKTTQNRNRIFNGRLIYIDRLKTALKCRIFLDVLAVLIERRGADAVQFASGQRRFQEVRGIVATFGRAGSNHGVQFVDKQNDLASGFRNFFQNCFQTVLKFTTKFCSCDQSAHVQRHHTLVFKALRNIVVDDPKRQPFGDGSLADTRLSDQYRVVLATARQYLNYTPDLRIASNDGVKLAFGRALDQVDGVFFKHLILVFWIGVGHRCAAAHLSDCWQKCLLVDAVEVENAFGFRFGCRHRQQ